jgi:hypothetical protein
MERRRRIAVKKTDQTNRGTWSQVSPGARILIIVVIKFTAPRMEETPARCKLKMERSTEAPAWAIPEAKGG